jgi:hypothetical protein
MWYRNFIVFVIFVVVDETISGKVVDRHSMETIYSTTADIATLHWKVVLFTGDRKGTRKCGLFVLPPQSTLSGRNARSLMKKKN